MREYKHSRLFFGTYVSIHCFYHEDIDILDITQRCWGRLRRIQESMNVQSAAGDVARINESGFEGIKVGDDVYNLLKDAKEFSRITKGAFDVTVFPLVALWKDAANKGVFPDRDSLEGAKDKVGYHLIQLEEDNRVFLKKEGMKIDLGAIAKGYAVDEIANILNQNGIKHFLIDAGGDIFCKGKDAGEDPWKVGLQDPLKKDSIIEVLKIQDAAVTTSGDYERFYTISGERFSHIIDPFSGYPQKDVISATVIAPTAEEADAFSTALCVMGGEKGIELIESLNNIEAMVIEEDKEGIITYQTKGFRKYTD